MIYTSYFGKIKSLPSNCYPIAICGKVPEWYSGMQYKKLAPKYWFFKQWKENHDNEFYLEHFNEEVLGILNPLQVVEELYALLPEEVIEALPTVNCVEWENPRFHIVLICYEKPDAFCHRHRVAEWFRENGIQCEEWVS